MTTIAQVAQAFAEGKPLKCHNAKTDGTSYWLHGNTIAFKRANGEVNANWCGWYGPTTANHLNKIAKAIGSPFRVSYANARLHSVKSFNF